MAIRLSCTVAGAQVDAVTALLEAAGATAVACDEVAGSTALYDEACAAEPRYWPRTAVSGFFTTEAAAGFARHVLADWAEDLELATVADHGWEIQDDWAPFPVAAGLWVYPSREQAPGDRVAIHLDRGLAFGTGTHPTTALCLEWIYETLTTASPKPTSLLDFGCGSGILAIAALKLGARAALAVDIDPLARLAACANAERNGVQERLTMAAAWERGHGAFDMVVANILAGPLVAHARLLLTALAPGGVLALSGILGDQVAMVAAAFPEIAFSEREREGWYLLQGSRAA